MSDRTRAERALAFLIHEIRDEWQEPGILATLRRVSDRALPAVAAAALHCAVHRTDQRTPDCIWRDGEHWQALDRMAGQQPAVVPPYLAETRCPTHDERKPCLTCQREPHPADPATIRALRAQHPIQPTRDTSPKEAEDE